MTSNRTLQSFLKAHPNSQLNLVQAQEYDIPSMSTYSALHGYTGILFYQALRAPLSESSPAQIVRGIVLRFPVVWQVYVDPESTILFEELLNRFKLHR